jgi:adenylate kinase
MNNLNLLFLGPPGVGKSTYARAVAKKYGIPAISAGKLLRAESRKTSSRGKIIKSYLDRGALVPNELVNDILIHRLKQEDCKNGLILDGTLSSLERAYLLHNNIKIAYVIYFKAPKKTILERIAGRRARVDDTPKVIERRITAYAKRNNQLTKSYQKQGILTVIDARPLAKEVIKQTISIINKYLESKKAHG